MTSFEQNARFIANDNNFDRIIHSLCHYRSVFSLEDKATKQIMGTISNKT